MKAWVGVGLLALAFAVGWLLLEQEHAPDEGPGRAVDAEAMLEAPRLEGVGAAPADPEARDVTYAPDAPRGQARIDVEVVTAGGAPIPGAHVALQVLKPTSLHAFHRGGSTAQLRRPLGARSRTAAHGRSDAEGRVAFEGLDPARSYRVVVRPAPPTVGASRLVVATTDAGAAERFVLGAGHPVALHVVGASGQGVVAQVAFERLASDEGGRARGVWRYGPVVTESDGRLRVGALPAGLHALRVLAPGYAERRGILLRVPAAKTRVIRLGVEGGATVHGVVRSHDGAPLPDVDVLVRCGGHPHETPHGLVRMTTTNAQGRYRFEGLPPGPLAAMEFVSPRHAVPDALGFRRELASGAEHEIDVHLEEGSFLRGRVLTAEGDPLPGAVVETSVRSGHGGNTYQLRVEAAADGAYALGPLPRGWGVATPRVPGHFCAEVAKGPHARGLHGVAFAFHGPGGLREIDFRMTTGLRLEGFVVDSDGMPVPGAHVALMGPKDLWKSYGAFEGMATDARGAFAFPGLPPSESYVVQVSRGRATQTATLRPDATNEITMLAPCSIVGRIVGGEPFETRLSLRIKPAVARARRLDTFDPTGGFAIHGLPAGATTLHIRDAMGRDVTTPLTLTLASGETREGVELAVPALLAIEGQVVDASGAGVPGHVVVVREDAAEGRESATKTREDGSFRIEPLVEGDYVVRARDAEEEVRARAGTGGLRLLRGPTNPTLRCRVLMPTGERLPRGTLLVLRSKEERNASVSREAVVHGEVHVACPVGTETVEIAVNEAFDAAGQPLSVRPFSQRVAVGPVVTIQLEAARKIAGRVVSEGGEAIPGVRLSAWSSKPRGASLAPPVVTLITDDHGRFTVVGLAQDETVQIRVQEVPAGFRAPAPLSVAPGEQDVVVVLSGGGALVRGRVVDPEGRGVADVLVIARFGAVSRATQSDSDGRFRLEGLPAGTRGTLEADPRPSDLPYQPTRLDDVPVGPNEILLRLDPGVLLSGTVSGEHRDGLPVEFVVGTRQVGRGTTDRAGRFRISLPSEGEGTVVLIDTRRNRYALLEGVTAPASDLELQLHPGATIRGRVERDGVEGPLLVSASRGELRVSELVAADDTFLLSGLPSGSYDLSVRRLRSQPDPTARLEGVSAGSNGVVLEMQGR